MWLPTRSEDSLGADPFWGQPGSRRPLQRLSAARQVFHLLLKHRPFLCSHLGLPVYPWQWDGCFLIALHINFPSWQSHGKDWLNLNCYYRVGMEPVMQKLMEVSQGRQSEKMGDCQWLRLVESKVRPWTCLTPTLGLTSSLPRLLPRRGLHGQLRLRSGRAASYTTHRGESEPGCHPSQPIQSTGHKSARRPGSCGSSKMECDGLVFTNSRGAPRPHHASHHSRPSTESSPSPHSIWFSHIKLCPPDAARPPPPPHTSPSFMRLLLPSSSLISSVPLSRVHWRN